MRSLVVVAMAAALAAPVMADYYVAGDFNGWNSAGDLMTDNGDGTFSAALNMSGDRHEFKITVGTWDTAWPASGNSWLYPDANGNVTITWDPTLHNDGWSGDTHRIGLNTDPGIWTAVGDWQSWNNGDPATAMIPVGGGMYRHEATLAPGNYQYKAVMTGTWDAVGSDNRSINADTWSFEVTAENPTAVMWLDALKGTIKVEVVPEPASAMLLLVGFGALLRRRA